MPDDKDEEYQFASDEGATDASTASSESSRPSGRPQTPGAINPELTQQARRVVFLALIIILSFTAFHFFGGKKKAGEGKQLDVAAKKVESKIAKGIASRQAKAGAASAAVKPAKASPVDALSSQVAQLRQDLMADDSRVHHLEMGMEHVEDAMANIGDAIADMRLQVQALTKQIKQLEKKVKAKAKPVVIKKRRPVRPKRVYKLTAIVRGRAWIRDARGNEMTVKPGDTIVDYGSVRMIDPIHGLITTTSGRVISYGQDDS